MPGGDVAAHHRLRALVQAPQQRAEGGRDHEAHQEGTDTGALAGGLEGRLGAAVEALGLAAFLHVALHHRDLAQHLGGDGAAVGHAVLAGAAELAHAAAEIQAGQHHQHQDAQHLHHHPGVGPDQRGQGAGAHHQGAQAHAQAAADHALHQGGVGGQAAEHLAGLGAFEELGALPQHVRVDGVAQVGGDALAQPADDVEARCREAAQRGGHAEQGDEVLAQLHHPRPGFGRHQALVDQGLQGQGKSQGAHRRQHQEHPGQRHRAAVRADEGQQPRERARRAPRRAVGFFFGHAGESMRRPRMALGRAFLPRLAPTPATAWGFSPLHLWSNRCGTSAPR